MDKIMMMNARAQKSASLSSPWSGQEYDVFKDTPDEFGSQHYDYNHRVNLEHRYEPGYIGSGNVGHPSFCAIWEEAVTKLHCHQTRPSLGPFDSLEFTIFLFSRSLRYV